MKVMFSPRHLLAIAGLILSGPALTAQITAQLFGPINSRTSPASAGFSTPYTFGSTAVSLTCPAGSTLTLQGPAGGNLLVDNNIIVTVTQGNVSNPPTNVCFTGATIPDQTLFTNHCFNVSWESDFQNYTGKNPDTFAATYGMAPVDITSVLQNASFDKSKPLIVTINLEDEGAVVASSTINMSTTCAFNGVTGPATVGGNPISGSDNQGTGQSFDFDTTDNKNVGFGYDVTGALPDIIKNKDGAIPQVSDLPLDPAQFQPVYAPGTSFATSNCLIHSGEVLSDGVTPACKLYTLECMSPVDGTLSGANCPVSSQINEVIQDLFDGPSFTLQNIVTPYGVFHQGMGYIMASEGWTGGNCNFDPASGLSSLACPLNLLTSFTGPGKFSGTGETINPNSTFLSVYGVPEDFTLATLLGEWPNHWVNTRTPSVKFFTQAPNFANGAWSLTGGKLVSLPGAGNYVPAPIKSLTFGISPANSLANPINQPIAGDNTLNTTANCSAIPFTAKSVANFNPAPQQLSVSSDGHFLLHYFAQDCAGTEELAFTQDQTGSWMTNFYTIQVNVDTKKPAVNGLAVPSPGSFKKGTTVYATYSCTDDPSGSGVVLCGTSLFGTETTYSTGTLKTTLDTNSKGTKSLTIYAIDGAGNTSSATVGYTVN